MVDGEPIVEKRLTANGEVEEIVNSRRVPARMARRARDAGVRIAAWSCRVTPDSMEIDRPVPVIL